jgi:HAD superfamily phosphatase
MSKPILIFDMDGVLVDVSDSYRETIACAAEQFTGVKPTPEYIQECKNRGGFNDDWKLTHYIVKEAGVDVPFEQVKERFQQLFLGGLMLRERWVAQPGLLRRLAERFDLAIFTGRPRAEAELTLKRFAGSVLFDPVVCMGETRNPKPHPEGLLHIVGREPDRNRSLTVAARNDLKTLNEPRPSGSGFARARPSAFYVGDTVDDAQCALAARVPFIGVAAPSNPLYLDLVFLFQAAGAYAIVDDINHLEEVLAS